MKQKKKSKISRIIKGIILLLLFAVLMINVYVIIQAKTKPNSVPSVFGYKPFIVLSGSMETEIYVGDLVFVKEVDASSLQVDDIIAFRDSENLVTTHRIVNVINTNEDVCFETKGDNNNVKDDSIVCSDNIEGKYQTKIAKIGSMILFIQEPIGFSIMMMCILIVCVFAYLLENNKINQQIELENEEERKEFEEFKREKARKQEENKDNEL